MPAKRVAVMVDEMYQVLEVWYPYYRLKEAGFAVNLVAAEANKQYHSKEGYPCTSDTAAGGANALDTTAWSCREALPRILCEEAKMS